MVPFLFKKWKWRLCHNNNWSNAERIFDQLRLEGVPPPRLEPEYVILLVKFVFKRIYPWWWASRRSDGNTISNKNSIVNDEF